MLGGKFREKLRYREHEYDEMSLEKDSTTNILIRFK